jgi:hypothetical protein
MILEVALAESERLGDSFRRRERSHALLLAPPASAASVR